MFNVVTAMTTIQNQRPIKKPRMTLLLTDSESDASDDETDVPNAWTVDLARYKDEDPIAETENPRLPGGDSTGIVFLFWQTL